MIDDIKVSDRTFKRIMAERDTSDIEARMVEEAELLNRLVARYFYLPVSYCSVRRCRRTRLCVGPMVATDRQRDRVRAQQMIGLQGRAHAFLPLCLESLPQETFRLVRAHKEKRWSDPGPEFARVLRYRAPQDVFLHKDQDRFEKAMVLLDEIYAHEDDQVMQVACHGEIVRHETLHEKAAEPEPAPADDFAPDLPDWLRHFDLKKREWETGEPPLPVRAFPSGS